MQGSGTDSLEGLTSGPGSTIYVAGVFSSAATTVGGYTLSNAGGASGTSDLYYARISSVDGSVLNAQRAGGVQSETLTWSMGYHGALAVDTISGDFYAGAYQALRCPLAQS
jgi:hypothetical protein